MYPMVGVLNILAWSFIVRKINYDVNQHLQKQDVIYDFDTHAEQIQYKCTEEQITEHKIHWILMYSPEDSTNRETRRKANKDEEIFSQVAIFRIVRKFELKSTEKDAIQSTDSKRIRFKTKDWLNEEAHKVENTEFLNSSHDLLTAHEDKQAAKKNNEEHENIDKKITELQNKQLNF